jgi:hypothetical protein
MKFIADSNTWGPFVDGRTYHTGVVFENEPAFGWRPSAVCNGEFRRVPVGRYAPAESLNGKIRLTGDWVE